MVGQNQDRRGDSHQLPAQKERDRISGRGNQLQRQQEHGHRRPGGARGGRSRHVADPVERGDGPDEPDHHHEEATESIRGEHDRVERQRHRHRQGPVATVESAGTGHRPGETDPDDRPASDSGAQARHDEDRRRHGQAGQGELGEQAPLDEGHRPVTCRRARTIASGSGGQPGTSRSTSTTSRTAPATP